VPKNWDHSEIVSIHFGMKDFSQTQRLIKMEMLGKKFKRLKAKAVRDEIIKKNNNGELPPKTCFDKAYAGFEKCCCLFDAAICYRPMTKEQVVDEARKVRDEFVMQMTNGQGSYPVCAYVTFRSMEGKERAIKEFHKPSIWKNFCACR